MPAGSSSASGLNHTAAGQLGKASCWQPFTCVNPFHVCQHRVNMSLRLPPWTEFPEELSSSSVAPLLATPTSSISDSYEPYEDLSREVLLWNCRQLDRKLRPSNKATTSQAIDAIRACNIDDFSNTDFTEVECDGLWVCQSDSPFPSSAPPDVTFTSLAFPSLPPPLIRDSHVHLEAFCSSQMSDNALASMRVKVLQTTCNRMVLKSERQLSFTHSIVCFSRHSLIAFDGNLELIDATLHFRKVAEDVLQTLIDCNVPLVVTEAKELQQRLVLMEYPWSFQEMIRQLSEAQANVEMLTLAIQDTTSRLNEQQSRYKQDSEKLQKEIDALKAEQREMDTRMKEEVARLFKKKQDEIGVRVQQMVDRLMEEEQSEMRKQLKQMLDNVWAEDFKRIDLLIDRVKQAGLKAEQQRKRNEELQCSILEKMKKKRQDRLDRTLEKEVEERERIMSKESMTRQHRWCVTM